jgi:D-hydroxyproline dehydrogenase subunit gamma
VGARRITSGVQRPEPVEIYVDGTGVAAFEGESVATALLAAGVRAFRRTPSGTPRGPFCNMGACFDCLVTIDGEPFQRACRSPVQAGMRVETTSDDAR